MSSRSPRATTYRLRCAAILGNPDASKTYWRLKTRRRLGLFGPSLGGGRRAAGSPRGLGDVPTTSCRRNRGGGASGLGVRSSPTVLSTSCAFPDGAHSSSFAEAWCIEWAAVVVSPARCTGPAGRAYSDLALTHRMTP